jgi:hypothetical protein
MEIMPSPEDLKYKFILKGKTGVAATPKNTKQTELVDENDRVKVHKKVKFC